MMIFEEEWDSLFCYTYDEEPKMTHRSMTMMILTTMFLTISSVDGWAQTSYAWEGTWKIKGSVQSASDEIGDPFPFRDEMTIRVEGDSVSVCFKNKSTPKDEVVDPFFVSCLKYPSNNLGCDTFHLRWNVTIGHIDDRMFSCSNDRIYRAISKDDGGCLSVYPSAKSYRQVDISEGDVDQEDQEDLERVGQHIEVVVDDKGVLRGIIRVMWNCSGSEQVEYDFVSVTSQRKKK